MAVSGLPAPPRRVLESFPEPPRAILERSGTPPEQHKCVLEAINVSKRAPGRSKTRSGTSKNSKMAASGHRAPPKKVLKSSPEPPRAILERSETPPEHHKCVLEAINMSKRAPGRSKSRSGSSNDSLLKLSGIENASFPASISTFVACPSTEKTVRLRCGLCVPPRLRSPIGLGGGREAQTINKA